MNESIIVAVKDGKSSHNAYGRVIGVYSDIQIAEIKLKTIYGKLTSLEIKDNECKCFITDDRNIISLFAINVIDTIE